jgi:hypothetical protein
MWPEIRSLVIGAVLEFIVFVAAIPQPSDAPMTPRQHIAGIMLLPFGAVANLLAALLPTPYGLAGAFVMFGTAFLIQQRFSVCRFGWRLLCGDAPQVRTPHNTDIFQLQGTLGSIVRWDQ